MKKLYTYLIVSFVAVLGMNDVSAQYCVPTMGTYWGWIQEAKTTGAVGNFSNTTGDVVGGRGAYNDYSQTMGVTTFPGQQWTISGRRSYSMGIWIDWNADNDFNDPGERVFNDGSSYSAAVNNFSQTITTPTTATAGKRVRMRLFTGYYFYQNPCGFDRTIGSNTFYYGGEAEDYYVFVTYDNNAGVDEIAAPIAECNGTAGTALDIVFSNTGVKDLDTLYFGGEIIDKTTGFKTTIPQKMWTGNLSTGQNSGDWNLYTYASGFKGGDTVCVWSFNPNNVPDSATSDDTLCYVVLTGIEGTYTVGDTTAGAHDFLSLKHALDFVMDAGAICDSVIIELSDTSWSSYYGQHTLKDVLGTSPTSPIIIRPKANNMYEDVRVWFDSCNEDYNHAFLVENITDVYFEGIQFSANTAKSPNYARVFEINDAENIYFWDCRIENDRANTADEDYNLVEINGVDELAFVECDFFQGANSIAASNGSDLWVEECQFWDMYNRSIHISDYDNFGLIANRFWSSLLIPNGTAVHMEQVNNDIEIAYNSIEIRNGQWPLNGLLMNTCNALNGSMEIYNNNFNLGQPWSGSQYRGINMTDVVGASIVHNTIAVSGNNQNNAAVYSNNGTRNVVFNNVLAAMVAGYAIHTPVAASIVSGDYNNVFAGNGTVGRLGSNTYNSLATWQTATGLDVNSVSVNPFFYQVSGNDLHVCNDKLFAAGTPISGIVDDWDGDTRDPNAPCIGADEFAPVSLFSLGNDYGLCNGDSTDLVAGKGLTGEIAIWRDLSSGNIVDTGQVLTVSTPGDYQVTLLNACGVNVDSITIITPAQVTLAPDTNICPGLTVGVDATIVNEDMYMWSSGETTAQITVTKQGVYTVTTTDAWGCLSVDSIDITYSNSANLSTQNDTIVCQGQAFGLFGGTDPSTNPTATYKWSGFINSNLETGANIFVDYDLLTADDTVIVCELTHRGCTTTDSLRVQKKPAPAIVNLTIMDNGLGFYVSTNNSTGENHMWDFGDTQSSSWDSPRHLYDSAGVYTVTYTNSNICGSADTTFEVEVKALSVGTNDNSSNVLIYPNPSNGQFNIDFTDVNADDLNIRIIDAQGRTVYMNEVGRISGSASEVVDLTTAGAGMYVVQITADGQMSNARITVK